MTSVFVVFERDGHPRDVIVCATRERAEMEVEKIKCADALDDVEPFRRRIMFIQEVQVKP